MGQILGKSAYIVDKFQVKYTLGKFDKFLKIPSSTDF